MFAIYAIHVDFIVYFIRSFIRCSFFFFFFFFGVFIKIIKSNLLSFEWDEFKSAIRLCNNTSEQMTA